MFVTKKKFLIVALAYICDQKNYSDGHACQHLRPNYQTYLHFWDCYKKNSATSVGQLERSCPNKINLQYEQKIP